MATLTDIEKKIDVKIKTLTLAVNENERISSRGKKNKVNKATRKAKSLRLNCSDITQVNTKMRNINYC